MKKLILQSAFNFFLAFAILLTAGAPAAFAGIISLAIMVALLFVPVTKGAFAGFITAGIEYKGQELTDIILRPFFQGQMMKELGVRVILGVKSSIKLTFFETTAKILKAYSSGFQGGNAVTVRQKKLELTEYKAEQNFSKQTYKSIVQNEIINKGGIQQNDITGTVVEQARLTLFMQAILEDMRRKFWLADKAKKTVSGGFKNDGSADVHYNENDGIWTSVIANAATSPNDQQIKRIAVSNGTVAQVDTHTLTGTSGTANISINSVNYLATFNATLTQTAADFVTTHAAALLALGIVVTSSVADIILTSNVAGQPFTSSAAVNVSGNLAGIKVATTANTPAQALGTDEALDIFKKMIEGAKPVFKYFLNSLSNRKMVRIYATDTMIENLVSTYEALGTEESHRIIVDGIERITYRGIPIFPMGIDHYLSNDFISPYPHRALLTLPDNLALALNGSNDEAEVALWFNRDENENRQRAQFEAGWDYLEPLMTVAAY